MLRIGCNYSVFKSNISPMWEDKINKNGGRWLIKDNELLDQYWMDIVIFFLRYHNYWNTKYDVLFLVDEYDRRNV